jgi:hypothetical protein
MAARAKLPLLHKCVFYILGVFVVGFFPAGILPPILVPPYVRLLEQRVG